MKSVMVIVLLLSFSLYSDTINVSDTSDVSAIGDTVLVNMQQKTQAIQNDTVGASSTTMAPHVSDSLMQTVPVAPPEPKKEVNKIKLIKREYPYRKNLWRAIGTMVFFGIIMASSQNWNPK